MPKGPFIPCDSLPSERARGLVWASVFRSAADEVAKTGTVTGTPTINHGVTLNGTTDYITYALNGQQDNLDPISFHCEFSPSFAADDGADHELFRGAGAGNFYVLKSLGNSLRFDAYGTNLLFAAIGDFQALWNVDGRNLLTCSCTTGAETMWFNGQEIDVRTAAFAAAAGSTSMTIGAQAGGGKYWGGVIKSLKFYNALLTEQEHLDAWYQGGV